MTTSRKQISKNTVVCHAPSVAWQRLGDEVVVLDVAKRRMIGLSSTSAALWEAISRGEALGTSVADVARQFNQPIDAVSAELLGFAEVLAQRGLLVERASDSAGSSAASSTVDELGSLRSVRADHHQSEIGHAYVAPTIAWEEHLEDAGVFASCGKDFGGTGGPQCTSSPQGDS